jgi:tetratricopeptide (TPR) repeat protein
MKRQDERHRDRGRSTEAESGHRRDGIIAPTGFPMGHRARIRTLAAAGFAAAAQLLAAQAPAARATDLYERALDLERRGNSPAALSLLWEAAGLAPHDGVIQVHLGEALERIGALDAAVDAYRAATDAHPAPRGASNSLVLALVKSGRSAEATARARAFTAEAPGDADRWFTLGLAQADVDVDGAIDSFHRALALDRRHALARYNLALVLYHADRLQPALDELHEALAIQPRPEVHYTLGIIYWHLGDLDRAAKALAEAAAANPAYADAHLALGSIFKARGDLQQAASALQRAVTLGPDLPPPHIVLAQTLALTGDEAGARREWAEADRLRTRSQQSQEAATWTAVGAQKLDAGDAAAAEGCFRRATQAFDGFAPAHYQLGRALERLGQHDAARAAFARAQQLNPALVPPR